MDLYDYIHTHVCIYIYIYNLHSIFSAIEKGHFAHSRKADLCCRAALPLLKSVWHTPGPKCPDEIMNWVPRIVRNRKSTFAIALATQGGKQKRSIAPDQTEWLEISPSCLEEQESRRGEHKKCWKGISCSKGLHRKMDCNPLLTCNFIHQCCCATRCAPKNCTGKSLEATPFLATTQSSETQSPPMLTQVYFSIGALVHGKQMPILHL